MDYELQVGPYKFSRRDCRNILELYSDDGATLWKIKERYYPLAGLNQIALSIFHGFIDAPKYKIPDYMFNSNNINIFTFNIGEYQPKPNGMNYTLDIGPYPFTRDDACNIDRVYRTEHLSLWHLKEKYYPRASPNEIALAIAHGWMDLPKHEVANFMFDSENIEMKAFNIGEPNVKWYQRREGQGRAKVKN